MTKDTQSRSGVFSRLFGATPRRSPPMEGLSGDYSMWSDALSASTGYATGEILDKTRNALLRVKNGEAIFERDSVLFDEIEYSWPLLSGLLWVAARSRGELNVLDFGGSLGSTYFQVRSILSHLPSVRWNVVEQQAHVAVGREDFKSDALHFYESVTEVIRDSKPNVILLSSVLQYVETPHDLLNELLSLDIDCAIVDRTPFWDGVADRLCVQTVPASIYAASYPSWIFSRPLFESHFRDRWHVVARFDNPDSMPSPVRTTFAGLLAARAGAG